MTQLSNKNLARRVFAIGPEKGEKNYRTIGVKANGIVTITAEATPDTNTKICGDS